MLGTLLKRRIQNLFWDRDVVVASLAFNQNASVRFTPVLLSVLSKIG